MLRKYSSVLICILIGLMPITEMAAQSVVKKVTIIITDAATGKPVEGAEIAFKALIGKYKKTTNAEGKALFDMFLITKSQDMNYTVKYPNTSKTYKAYTGKISLIEGKDTYEYTTSIQPDVRKISFKISDEKQKPLAEATVILKDNTGNQITSKSDANGIAYFDISPTAQYKNASLSITKLGLNNYIIPVDINDQTSQVAVITPQLTPQTIIVDGGFTEPPKGKPDLLGTTNNVSFSSMPPGYTPTLKNPKPIWGPYTPDCDANPLASVPTFSSFFVESEKTLLDNITNSCLGAASDAVTALVDLTENVVSMGSKLNAVWSQSFQNIDLKKMAPGVDKAVNETKKIVEEEKEKTKKAMTEAVEKTKDMLDKMKELAAGPEMYAITCMWDGIKDYAIPEPLTKLKKSTEAFTKAKTAMQEKLEAIKARLASGEAPKFADKELFTNWKDVTENVEKTTSGLNLIVAYLSEPKKLLPYETQVNLAITAAEKLSNTLLTDCQIREADRQIKQGTNAGQAALAAARKYAAQQKKGESKWRQIVNDYVTKNFKQEDRGWEYYGENDFRRTMLPEGAYGSWVNYHNEAIRADNEAIKLEGLLNKLEGQCKKIQSMAGILNDRIKKYEAMYTKGLIALEGCKLDEARDCIKQMQSLEKSECGHFYPKPYDKTHSEELEAKIKVAVEKGKCKETSGGSLITGVWYRCEGGYTITIGGSSLTWEQDLKFWEKPNNWRVKDPRIFSNVVVNGNKISGRWESNPEYEEYLPGSELGKKKAKISGTFEFNISQTTYGPIDERIVLEGMTVYDSDYCKNCKETWCFIRVKKW